jgi:PAS domain S-box-containing protein
VTLLDKIIPREWTPENNSEADDLDISLDVLFRVFNNENDVTVTDQNGVILRVSDSYEEHYGISRENIVGKTVYQAEEQGIFYPSVTAAVIRLKRKATLLQKNKLGATILTTGVPVFDNAHNIKYIISFNAIDIADLTMTQDKYERLKEVLAHYNSELNKLRLKETNSFGSEMQSEGMRSC